VEILLTCDALCYSGRGWDADAEVDTRWGVARCFTLGREG
jgi:hypothetical protein